MPLTVAHPAAVLPFSRKSKYIHFSALVLGSMSPDFEYFLNGKPSGAIGHSIEGFFTFNFPMIVIIYILYAFFIHRQLTSHLPAFIEIPIYQRTKTHSLLNIIVFSYCSFIGFMTHIIWDSFTHLNGGMVTRIEYLSYTIMEIPIYKFLQHGSTLIGLFFILVFMMKISKSNEHKGKKTSKEKWIYWSINVSIGLLLFIFWFIIEPVSFFSIGVHVVRIIDCAFLALVITGIWRVIKQ